MHELPFTRPRSGGALQGDADGHIRLRLDLVATGKDGNVKETGITGRPILRPGIISERQVSFLIVFRIRFAFRKNLRNAERRVVGNPRIVIIFNGDGIGFPVHRQNIRADLRIRHLNRPDLSVRHCDGQRLHTRERLQRDQSPLVGGNLRFVQTEDLLGAQFLAVFTLQPVGRLQRTQGRGAFGLPDPDEGRIGERNAPDIGDKAVDARPVGIFPDAEYFRQLMKGNKTSAGQAVRIHISVHRVLEVHRVRQHVHGEGVRFKCQFIFRGVVRGFHDGDLSLFRNVNHHRLFRFGNLGRGHADADRELRLNLPAVLVAEGNIQGLHADHFTGNGLADRLFHVRGIHNADIHGGPRREGARIGVYRDGDLSGRAGEVRRNPGLVRLLSAGLILEDNGPTAVVLAAGGGVLLRVFRQHAVAHQDSVIEGVLKSFHGRGVVALNGLQGTGCRVHGRDQAHMVRKPVSLPVEEDNIAGLGDIASRIGVQIPRLQLLHPGAGAAFPGHRGLRDIGVLQAEGHEHGAPVPVGQAIPGTVTGVALQRSVFLNLIIPFALAVAQLALRHGDQVPGPVSAEFHVGEEILPVTGGLQVGAGIAFALLFPSGPLRDFFVAEFHDAETILPVDVQRHLFLAADQLAAFVVAGGVVFMHSLLAADQNLPLSIAFIRMDMGALAVGQAAGQFLRPLVAAVIMDMRVGFPGAGQLFVHLVAVVGVFVLLAVVGADQLTPDQFIAVRRMLMGVELPVADQLPADLLPAAFAVLMPDRIFRADQISFRGIAGGVVHVRHHFLQRT